MRYPTVIKEAYPSRDIVSVTLVKTIGEPLTPEIPTPEIPSPGGTIEVRPLPDFNIPPPSNVVCQSPINILELPYSVHGFGANYKLRIDGFDINPTHIDDLRNSGQWNMPVFTDTVSEIRYIDWSCGSNAGIQLTTRGEGDSMIPTYEHQTTRHLVNFIPQPEQVVDYIRDAEQELRELNPDAIITTNEQDTGFSVCMRPLYNATSTEWRYDDSYTGSHWSDTDVDRFNKVKLKVVNDVLNYSVNVNGEIQNVGNLIGKTLTFGSLVLSFTYMGAYVEAELTYDGIITPEINAIYYNVRLTPNGDKTTWADQYTRNNVGEAHSQVYEDGVIDMSLDVQELKGIPPEQVPPSSFQYTVTTDFKTTPIMTQLNASIADTQARARLAWLEWLVGKNITHPEQSHQPRTITEVTMYKGGISNEYFVLANYTKSVMQYKDSLGVWQTSAINTLIGDGSRLYLMKSEAELRAENQYPYNYVSTNITLEVWMGTVGYGWVNGAIMNTFYNIAPDNISGLLTEYTFESDWDELKYGEVVVRKFINTGIKVRCETSVSPGSTSSPTVAPVFGNMVPYGTLTRGGQV